MLLNSNSKEQGQMKITYLQWLVEQKISNCSPVQIMHLENTAAVFYSEDQNSIPHYSKQSLTFA